MERCVIREKSVYLYDMDIIQMIEIFAFVTGVAYIVLEVLQKNAMWVVGFSRGRRARIVSQCSGTGG